MILREVSFEQKVDEMYTRYFSGERSAYLRSLPIGSIVDKVFIFRSDLPGSTGVLNMPDGFRISKAQYQDDVARFSITAA